MNNNGELWVFAGEQIVYFWALVALMDDEIREDIHVELSPCSAQAFTDAYCRVHQEKFGEAFGGMKP